MTDTTFPTITCPIFDIGANLTHESFQKDRDDVVAQARDKGVSKMVITGCDVASSLLALDIAKQYDLLSTAGVHPHEASTLTQQGQTTLTEMQAHPHVVAVGECGLDYYRNLSDKTDQKSAFVSQLEIAVRTGKPVFLHEREASRDMLDILNTYRPKLSRAVIHCFTGNKQELHDYLDLDLYIGITGWICDERRGMHLRNIVSDIPQDKLMIETDSPYLLPRTIRPKPKSRRNQPKYLPYVVQMVADACQTSYEQMAERTTSNANTFFGIHQ